MGAVHAVSQSTCAHLLRVKPDRQRQRHGEQFVNIGADISQHWWCYLDETVFTASWSTHCEEVKHSRLVSHRQVSRLNSHQFCTITKLPCGIDLASPSGCVANI